MQQINYTYIAERINYYRKQQNLTVEELAFRAGISGQHCSHIINARARLSLTCTINLCNALGVSPNDILCHNVTNNSVMPELLDEVNKVFSDCSPSEMRHLLAVCTVLKQSLRLDK